MNGQDGLIAVGGNPNNPPGITFTADVITGGANTRYIQNMISAQTSANGSGAGAVFTDGLRNLNYLPDPNPVQPPAPAPPVPVLKFPCLDSGDPTSAFYKPDFDNTKPNPAG